MIAGQLRARLAPEGRLLRTLLLCLPLARLDEAARPHVAQPAQDEGDKHEWQAHLKPAIHGYVREASSCLGCVLIFDDVGTEEGLFGRVPVSG